MKFRLNEKCHLRSIPASQLKPGEMANYLGEIVIRAGGGSFCLISLSHPQNYWTAVSSMMVTPLNPGSTVTLEQE